MLKKYRVCCVKIMPLVIVIISAFLLSRVLLYLSVNKIRAQSKISEESVSVPSVTPSPTVSPTSTPIPTLAPTFTPTPTLVFEHSKKANEEKYISADNIIGIMNSYRQSRGLNSLNSDQSLCEVAGKRAQELLDRGSLDNHDGWRSYGGKLDKFSSAGEIIAYTSFLANGEYFVNTVWANSSSHAAIMANPEWTYGCGAIANGEKGYFATFEFGRY